MILPVLFEIQTLKAMFTWPKFSVASYVIVKSLLRLGIHPHTVIDVGANIGQFTVAASKLFENPKVFAFEPLPVCVEKLRVLATKIPDIEIYKLAIGDRNGTVDFHVSTFDQASSLLKLNHGVENLFSGLKERKRIRVNVVTLDDFFEARTLKKPVLLKIDVQGGEKSVILGGTKTLRQIDYVLLEASFTPMYVGEPLFLELVELLKTLKFDFMRPVSFLKSPRTGEILQADILFRNNAL